MPRDPEPPNSVLFFGVLLVIEIIALVLLAVLW